MCRAYAACRSLTDVFPYDFIEAPRKVCLGAMDRACRRGYVEYGVSLRCGWLTAKGLNLVNEGEKT